MARNWKSKAPIMAQAVQDLLVWQRAIELSLRVYELTRGFPREEMYGLTSQLRRASVSVASDIAEGRGRLTEGEFRYFLGLAQGSNYELQTQLVIARRLGLGSQEILTSADGLSVEVSKMIASLLKAMCEVKARS